jgi:hypothetical protein
VEPLHLYLGFSPFFGHLPKEKVVWAGYYLEPGELPDIDIIGGESMQEFE